LAFRISTQGFHLSGDMVAAILFLPIVLIPVGAGLGYLAGGLAAGLFCLAEEYEKRYGRRRQMEQAERDEEHDSEPPPEA